MRCDRCCDLGLLRSVGLTRFVEDMPELGSLAVAYPSDLCERCEADLIKMVAAFCESHPDHEEC